MLVEVRAPDVAAGSGTGGDGAAVLLVIAADEATSMAGALDAGRVAASPSKSELVLASAGAATHVPLIRRTAGSGGPVVVVLRAGCTGATASAAEICTSCYQGYTVQADGTCQSACP